MRIRTASTVSLIAAITALMMTTSASAVDLPHREVRINEERLALLPPEDQQRVLEIRDRLEALIATDRSSLDRTERAELRTEWKELKGEMEKYNRNGNTVYISTAALIIIILLLIILL
jgi:hypothetical protein